MALIQSLTVKQVNNTVYATAEAQGFQSSRIIKVNPSVCYRGKSNVSDGTINAEVIYDGAVDGGFTPSRYWVTETVASIVAAS